jgi:fungal STAND N-terminal Goodbye domain
MMASTSGAVLLGQIGHRESPDAWKIAKARFLDGLNDSERSIFNEATVENLFYCASNDERKDRDESKARLVLGKIQPLVSAIEDYGKAMDTHANIASLSISSIWGSIRVLLAIANSHSKFYSRIIDTFSRIGDILPRFSKYLIHPPSLYVSRMYSQRSRGLSKDIRRTETPEIHTCTVNGLSGYYYPLHGVQIVASCSKKVFCSKSIPATIACIEQPSRRCY